MIKAPPGTPAPQKIPPLGRALLGEAFPGDGGRSLPRNLRSNGGAGRAGTGHVTHPHHCSLPAPSLGSPTLFSGAAFGSSFWLLARHYLSTNACPGPGILLPPSLPLSPFWLELALSWAQQCSSGGQGKHNFWGWRNSLGAEGWASLIG